MPATRAQIATYNLHKRICTQLGIQQITLAHRKLKGTEAAQSPTGNVVYTGPGAIQSFTPQYISQTKVWMVTMTFIRGEEKAPDQTVGVESVSYVQAQCPAIDDNLNAILISQDDHVLDVNTPWIYMCDNPTISPDGAFWTMMLERQR